jgi:hypothetical protein
MNRLLKAALLLSTGTVLFTACDKDEDPALINEEELITTVRLTFAPVGGGSPVIATWQDLDGDGGNPPTVSSIALAKGRSYTLTLDLSDDSGATSENITEEIEEEAEEHQFFFRTSGLTGMTIAYNDKDQDNHPIGLSNTVTIPNAASTGTLTVILRHGLNKGATGVAGGDPANAGGETDVETTPPFAVTIQ